MQEGGGFVCRKGVFGGFLRWFLCRKGGGSYAGRGFLRGSSDGSCAGRGGFLSGMRMPQPTHCARFQLSNRPPLAL